LTRAAVSGRPPEFRAERRSLSGAPGMFVSGEVDVSTVAGLTAALDDAIRESAGAFVVDLTAVDFLDSTGISVLVRARALLARDERALAVVCPPGPVRRIFEVSGIADLLALFDSREAAAAALRPAR
jgi:anti-sigma B factor antagonist